MADATLAQLHGERARIDRCLKRTSRDQRGTIDELLHQRRIVRCQITALLERGAAL